MSARRILGLESVPRVGLFAHESGTRAGFRTSRDSSVSIRRGRRKIEGRHLQYERTEMARPLDSYVEKGEALKASKREAAPKISLPTRSAERVKIPGRRPGR